MKVFSRHHRRSRKKIGEINPERACDVGKALSFSSLLHQEPHCCSSWPNISPFKRHEISRSTDFYWIQKHLLMKFSHAFWVWKPESWRILAAVKKRWRIMILGWSKNAESSVGFAWQCVYLLLVFTWRKTFPPPSNSSLFSFYSSNDKIGKERRKERKGEKEKKKKRRRRLKEREYSLLLRLREEIEWEEKMLSNPCAYDLVAYFA